MSKFQKNKVSIFSRGDNTFLRDADIYEISNKDLVVNMINQFKPDAYNDGPLVRKQSHIQTSLSVR